MGFSKKINQYCAVNCLWEHSLKHAGEPRRNYKISLLKNVLSEKCGIAAAGCGCQSEE